MDYIWVEKTPFLKVQTGTQLLEPCWRFHICIDKYIYIYMTFDISTNIYISLKKNVSYDVVTVSYHNKNMVSNPLVTQHFSPTFLHEGRLNWPSHSGSGLRIVDFEDLIGFGFLSPTRKKMDILPAVTPLLKKMHF